MVNRPMKDSGIEWIGDIPEKWEVIKLRQMGNFTASGIDKLINPEEPTVQIINYTDIYNNNEHLLKNKKYMIVSAPLEKVMQHQVHKGDLIFTPSSETVDDIGISALVIEELPNTAFSYHVLRYKFNKEVDLNYKKYICNNFYVYSSFSCKAKGTIRKTLSREDFKEQLVLLPPLQEQQKIAEFLDEKCGYIDSVLEKTKASIEDYKKLKQSVITQAVTKGICPNRPMKDSGIEWIGEVPNDWKVEKLKNYFSFGKGLPITKEDLKETGIEVISYGQIHSKDNTGTEIKNELIRYVAEDWLESNPQSLVNQGDFIFADTSEDIDGCGNCVFVDKSLSLFAGYHSIILSPLNKKYCKYLAYLFKSDVFRRQIRSHVAGIKVFSITQRILKKLTIILPSDVEQQEIVDYLDNKCAEIDKLIEKKEQLISELETYKKSLIYEYVTGKKEVV